MTPYESREEFERDLREYGRQDALADECDRLFEREYHERIAEDTRAALIEACTTNQSVTAAFREYDAEHGPVTPTQFVSMLEQIDAQIWSDEYAAQACELHLTISEQ